MLRNPLVRLSLILSLLFAPLQGAAADPPHPDVPEVSYHTFLPFLVDGKAVPDGEATSITLIEAAEEAGTISHETALIYRVFAVFEDPRLPTAYAGPGVGADGDLALRQVVLESASLSAAAQATLAPFFVPPNYPGSWYAQRSGHAPQADWESVSAAGGKVLFWYPTAVAGAKAKAQGLAAQTDAIIWSKETSTMNKEPQLNANGQLEVYLWSSYRETDGTIVAFDASTLGVTVPTSTACAPSGAVIYLPINKPLGTPTSPGLIQYFAHELMHAIQFAYPVASCAAYSWLYEATANWAEDLVYPKANSEWITGDARDFMQHPDYRLDDLRGNHEYGAYLLPYYLSHHVDSPEVVRRMWENAGTRPNSYLAVKDAVPEGARDYFWNTFLIALWNQTPFDEYYKTNDDLTETPKVKAGDTIQISAGGQETTKPLSVSLATGAARFYRITFDGSVRSFTLLNGLGSKLSKGNDPSINGDLLESDETYLNEDLDAAGAAGVTLDILLKVVGKDWMPLAWNTLGRYSHCVDNQGDVEELVLILSNGDWEHPDRILKETGLPTTVFANDLPCAEVSGSSTETWYNAGVTHSASATFTYAYPDGFEDPDYYLDNIFVFPQTTLFLKTASVNWEVSGVDSAGCTHDGSGSFNVSENDGVGHNTITIFGGLLSGSPTWRGYQGAGAPWNDEKISVKVQCKDGSRTDELEAPSFLWIPLMEIRDQVKVGGGGALNGSWKRTYSWGDWEEYTWSIQGVP